MQEDVKKQAKLYALVAEIYAMQAEILSMDVANQERLASGDMVAYNEECFTDYTKALMDVKSILEQEF